MLVNLSVLLQHLLFFFLVVVAPIWDWRYTSRLKREPSPERKVGVYQTLCAWLWASAIVALLTVGWQPLFHIYPGPGEIAWFEIAWVRRLTGILLALFAAGTVLPLAIVLWKKLTHRPRKYAAAEKLKSMAWFLPATATERRWFGIVSVTAGICEEILFRGFLLHYFHVFPWKMNLTLALFLSALIFGAQHLYQGVAGAAQTAIFGFLLSLLFLLTGSLLGPMILHAVMDLRMLAILRPPEAVPSAEGGSGR